MKDREALAFLAAVAVMVALALIVAWPWGCASPARGASPGHGYLVSSDYREVIEVLKGWGVVRSGIHVRW